MNNIYNIAIIGAGGWGTAVAVLLASKGHNVTLWTHETEVILEINDENTNSKYLPGVKLPDNIRATAMPDLLQNSDLFVIAIPTQFIRRVITNYQFPSPIKLSLISQRE